MATLRNWLNEADFDWDNGRIIIQPDTDGFGWGRGDTDAAYEADRDSEILDEEFDYGFGAPEAPAFIAQDEEFMYFPSMYDGATSLVVVARDLGHYIGEDASHTPYAGG